jgi:lactoylglutathione lyase
VIVGVSRVVIDVDDQDRAKRFWVDKVGCTVAFDESFGGERWVEIRPPGGAPLLVLVPRREGDTPSPPQDGLPTSNIFFTCDDVEDTYEAMSARGVSFPTAPTEMHFGWWSVFEDDDGNRFALSVTARDRP